MKALPLLAAAALIFSAEAGLAQTPSNVVAVVNAANAFLATLSAAQSNSAVYSLALTNARNWSNLPIGITTRNGPRFDSLSAAQLTAAVNITTVALGTNGASLFNEIRLADAVLAASAGGYGSNLYFVAFVGVPSTNAPWMLQLGGHHIAYNISFNTTNISATPFFLGVEPKVWTNSGVIHSPMTNKFAATQALRATLTSSALLSGTFSDIVFGANGSGNHDNYPQTYPTTGRGQSYTNLTATQQGLVKAVIESWLTNTAPAVYAVLQPIYESDLALSQTYVGYSGSDVTLLSSSGNYVRIDGPRVWIEWSCQNGIVFSGIHYHAIWRDKMSDYGSSFGILTTNLVPAISTQPTNRTVTVGGSTTFTVGVGGTAPFVYQWYKDSSVIAGETNASYTIASVAAGSAGNYSVYVLNNVGTVTSTNATLIVTNSVSTVSTNLAFLITNGVLQLSWPDDHIGWRLQVQTNSLTLGIGTNWQDVSNSTATNLMRFPIASTNAAVFYRMIYP
jgi:hypothetical protein